MHINFKTGKKAKSCQLRCVPHCDASPKALLCKSCVTEAVAVQGSPCVHFMHLVPAPFRSSFPPLVLRVMAGEMKKQNRIGSRDLSAAISGAEVGQAERNGGRASHAAHGIWCPFAPEDVLRLFKIHHRRSEVGDRPVTLGHSSSNLGKDFC